MMKVFEFDPDEDLGASEAWDREIVRRVEEIRNGKAVGKPAEQVFAELRDQYPSPDD